MRLIDADKELENLSEMVVKGETFTTAVEFAKIILRNAPTVEATPISNQTKQARNGQKKVSVNGQKGQKNDRQK